jgi:hypothetical protein
MGSTGGATTEGGTRPASMHRYDDDDVEDNILRKGTMLAGSA